MSDDEERDPIEADEVEGDVEADAEGGEVEAAAGGDAPAAAAREEPIELRSVEERKKLRDQMQADIERFLKSGGRIEHVEPAAINAPTNTAGVNDIPG